MLLYYLSLSFTILLCHWTLAFITIKHKKHNVYTEHQSCGLSDLTLVFTNFFAWVTIKIVSPTHKDRTTKQQGPLGLSVLAEDCRHGFWSFQSIWSSDIYILLYYFLSLINKILFPLMTNRIQWTLRILCLSKNNYIIFLLLQMPFIKF